MKKIITAVLIICLLGVVTSVFSFANATVSSAANLKIVSSENALISLNASDFCIEAHTLSQEDTENQTAEYSVSGSVCIRNNMTRAIVIRDFEAVVRGRIIPMNINGSTIAPGREIDIPLGFTTQVGEHQIECVLNAKWEDGEAQIKHCIPVVVRSTLPTVTEFGSKNAIPEQTVLPGSIQ